MAVTSQFVKYPNLGLVEIADGSLAENNLYDGSNAVDLFTAGSARSAKTAEAVGATEGARVERIIVISQGQINSCIVRIFIENAAGTIKRLFREIAIAANTTASSSVAGSIATSDITGGLPLGPGDKLKATVSVLAVGQKVNVIAVGGDF